MLKSEFRKVILNSLCQKLKKKLSIHWKQSISSCVWNGQISLDNCDKWKMKSECRQRTVTNKMDQSISSCVWNCLISSDDYGIWKMKSELIFPWNKFWKCILNSLLITTSHENISKVFLP